MKKIFRLFHVFLLALIGNTQSLFAQPEFDEIILSDNINSLIRIAFTEAVDFDGDGDLDVLVYGDDTVANTDRVQWHENLDGGGRFGNARIIYEDDAQFGVTGDIDNDGDIDVLIATRFSRNTLVFMNEDSGNSFVETFTIEGADSGVLGTSGSRRVFPSMHLADLDNDGFLDLITKSSEEGGTRWYRNNSGDGTFADGEVIFPIRIGNFIGTYDFDEDGDLDIIATSLDSDSEIEWYENIDAGADFQLRSVASAFEEFESVVAADVNGDDHLDLIVGVPGEPLRLHVGDGTGNFAAGVALLPDFTPSFPVVTSADYDADGDPDLIVQEKGKPLTWLENTDGLGSFTIRQQINLPEDLGELKVKDIDGDGLPDFLIGFYDNSGGTGWYKNLGSASSDLISERLATNPGGRVPERPLFVDIDNNGFKDYVVLTKNPSELQWFKNVDGAGDFQFQGYLVSDQRLPLSDPIEPFIFIDIDTDGDNDLIYTGNRRKFLGLKKNDGSGNFDELIVINEESASGSSYTRIDMGDVDGDGDLDLMATGNFYDFIDWSENLDGAGNFGPMQTIIELSDFRTRYQIQLQDLNNDGLAELVYPERDGANYKIVYLLNEGGGTFSTTPQDLALNSPVFQSGIRFIDLDFDGDNDIVFAGGSGDGSPFWYENLDGAFNFADAVMLFEEFDAVNVGFDVVDFDADGDLDIISSLQGSDQVVWYKNTGPGTAFNSRIVLSSGTFDNPQQTTVDDINLDGNPDVMITTSRSQIAWMRNRDTPFNQVFGRVAFEIADITCESLTYPLEFVGVRLSGSRDYLTFTNAAGYYTLFPDPGSYTAEVPNPLSIIEINPGSVPLDYTGFGNSDEIDFCASFVADVNDLRVSVFSYRQARPGFRAGYLVTVRNTGTAIMPDTQVRFNYDDTKLQFDETTADVLSDTPGELVLDLGTLDYFGGRDFILFFDVFPPPTTEIGDVLEFIAEVSSSVTDEVPENNIFNFSEVVEGSYDPNDITVMEGEEIVPEQVGDFLNYRIRFQNEGTAEAIFVVVENELDPLLDWSTFEMIGLSHPGRVTIEDGNQVTFRFDDINLVPRSVDEEASQGYILYRIKPVSDLAIGQTISNQASIFFDFNPPIDTNVATTTLVDPLSVEEFGSSAVRIYPNPAAEQLYFDSTITITGAKVMNLNGQVLAEIQNGSGLEQIGVQNLASGLYFVQMVTEDGRLFNFKFLKN